MCNKTYLFLFQFQASHSKRDCLVAAFTLLSPDHSKEEKKKEKKKKLLVPQRIPLSGSSFFQFYKKKKKKNTIKRNVVIRDAKLYMLFF
jgi:hypothetical protein